MGTPKIRVKTHTEVHDPQTNFIVCATEFGLGLLRMTMFNHVSKRFLGDSEETQRHILRDFGEIPALGKFDFDLMLRAHLFTKTHQGRSQTYKCKLAGVKLMG